MKVFYKVTPHSVLFFRDPRPFTAGEQSLARLQFPPRLTPFLGALRTKYLEIKSKEEKKEIPKIYPKYEPQIKRISVFWFSLMKDDEPIIPVPYDAFSRWEKLNDDLFVFDENHPLWIPLKQTKEKDKNTPAYLTAKGFIQYLNGQTPSEDEVLYFDDIYQVENRVGLTLSKDTKTSERSRFYRISVARLKKDVGFLVGVEMEDDMLPEEFTTRLGGEGHIAVWERTDEFKVFIENSGNFRELVALTHIPIKNDGTANYEITNWCINKLDITSGWDFWEYRPKPLRKTLKPGSVLSVKRLNGTKPEIYRIEFNDGNVLEVVKNMNISIKNRKPGLSKFDPKLDEPDTLLLVKR